MKPVKKILTMTSALLMTSGYVNAVVPVDTVGVVSDASLEDPVAYHEPVFNSPEPGSTLTMSRYDCLRIALDKSPTIQVADMEIKRVDYSKKETVASLFPQIDFSAAYQRTIELQTIRMNMGGQSQSLKMGSDNMWNFGFSASLPLVAPTLWKAVQISDTEILAKAEAARTSRIEMVDQVNQAYYGLLLAIASQKVIQDNYDLAKFNADLYQKQFEVGTASEYDVLRSSVQVKNIEPELLQADIAVKQCKLTLKVLMGISTDFDIIPADSLAEYRDQMASIPHDRDHWLSDNPSLRELDIQGKMLDQTVTLRKFAWIPTLAATFNLSWNSLSNGSPFKNQEFNPYSVVGLSLSVPIFAGGKRLYSLKQAKVQRQELALQRENLLNSLNMQVDIAIDNVNRQAAQIESSEESVQQAEKAHQIMQKSFEIGAATYLNLRDSEMAETSAKLAYYQAIYNYLISQSQLDRLLGRDTPLPLN